MIAEKDNAWGNNLIAQIANDLKAKFSEMKGLSRSNLFNAKKFYNFYSDKLIQKRDAVIVQQRVGQFGEQLFAQ